MIRMPGSNEEVTSAEPVYGQNSQGPDRER